MTKYFLIFTTLTLFPLVAMGRNSATIKISVTIPPLARIQTTTAISHEKSNQGMLEETKNILRDGEKIILKTVVPR